MARGNWILALCSLLNVASSIAGLQRQHSHVRPRQVTRLLRRRERRKRDPPARGRRRGRRRTVGCRITCGRALDIVARALHKQKPPSRSVRDTPSQ